MGVGVIDRKSYMPTKYKGYGPSAGAVVARRLAAAALVGLVGFGGYTFWKDTSAAADPVTSDAQVAQLVQRVDELEHRLEQMEKRRNTSRGASAPAPPSRLIATAAEFRPPKPELNLSRPTGAESASSSSVVAASAINTTPQNHLSPEGTDPAASRQQWEATANRLGNVVGELDFQRDVIERDRARLDELAGRFAQDSQPFTLEKGSTRQQVGPVWLRLEGTDPKNQRYTMRLSVDDQTVELKDRALHEAIQFYASNAKLSFELVVSRISRDGVAGRLVLPQTSASR